MRTTFGPDRQMQDKLKAEAHRRQQQVNYLYVNSIRELCDHAYGAKNLLEAKSFYIPPPVPEHSILPECFYKRRTVKFDGLNARNLHKASQFNNPVVQIAGTVEPTGATNQVGSSNEVLYTSVATTRGSITTERTLLVSKKNSNNNRNKYREEGPQSGAYCWSCAWPGYTKR